MHLREKTGWRMRLHWTDLWCFHGLFERQPAPMKRRNTYEDRDETEGAAEKLTEEKSLASKRDATVVIYNLFGIPSWGNFIALACTYGRGRSVV